MQENYLYFLILQMVLDDDLSPGTINFFRKVYPTLTHVLHMSCTAMGALTFMSHEGARKHVIKLQAQGYLERVHHQAWRLSDRALTNKDLLRLLRKANA